MAQNTQCDAEYAPPRDQCRGLPAQDQPHRGHPARIKGHDLATQYASQVGPRLAASLLTTLAADLLTIGSAVPAAKTAHAGSKQATTAQNTTLKTTYNSVTAVRTAVGRKKPAKDVSQAYAVGLVVNRNVVKDVKDVKGALLCRGGAARGTRARSGGMT